jgi:hypothetical protein
LSQAQLLGGYRASIVVGRVLGAAAPAAQRPPTAGVLNMPPGRMQVGWFPEWTITEDYALSMELKMAGFTGRYLPGSPCTLTPPHQHGPPGGGWQGAGTAAALRTAAAPSTAAARCQREPVPLPRLYAALSEPPLSTPAIATRLPLLKPSPPHAAPAQSTLPWVRPLRRCAMCCASAAAGPKATCR